MDVLGMRSKAGIKWEDTRRSFRAVRGALDVAILEKACSNAKVERTNLLNRQSCKRSVLYAPGGKAYLGPNSYVISKLEVSRGSTPCLKTNTLPVLPRICLEVMDNVTSNLLCNRRLQSDVRESIEESQSMSRTSLIL